MTFDLQKIRSEATVGWSATDYAAQQRQEDDMARQRKASTEETNGAATAVAEKPKKAKQQYIPGTEPQTIKEIEEAADEYREVRDKRMRLTEKEAEANDALLELMHKHGITSYEFDGYTVEIASTEKAKVKKRSGDEVDED